MESMCHCYTWMQQILFPAPSYRKFAQKINSNFISNIKFSILFQKVKNYFCGLVRRVDLGSQKPRISSLDRDHFITVAWFKSNSQKRFNNVEKTLCLSIWFWKIRGTGNLISTLRSGITTNTLTTTLAISTLGRMPRVSIWTISYRDYR